MEVEENVPKLVEDDVLVYDSSMDLEVFKDNYLEVLISISEDILWRL